MPVVSLPYQRVFLCALVAPFLIHCSQSGANASSTDASFDTSTDAGGPDGSLESGLDTATDSRGDGTFGDGGGPVISNIVITPNPNSVLSATLTFTTNEPSTDQVQVTNVGDGGADNSFSVPLGGEAPATSHSMNLIGMRASSPFRIDITSTNAASRSTTASVTYATQALPAAIPPITVVVNDKTRTSPGFTMMDLWAWNAAQPFANFDFKRSSIVILDADGQVVWYYMPTTPIVAQPQDPKKLPNGDIVYLLDDHVSYVVEIDMMGNVVRSIKDSALGLDYLSHEIFPEADGNLLSMSSELRSISGYPTGDGGTTTYSVVGDRFAEFDLDGGVHGEWSTFDMLNPLYEGFPSEFNVAWWNWFYRDAGATKDWTHGNSVVADPSDDTIVASSRSLSWIYKFARNDGGPPQLLWRLGPNGDFTLTNAGEGFQYNQHCATVLPNGDIMTFDDGDDRPSDGGTGLYSRAVEFSLDTTQMQATIVWQFRGWPSFYSPYVGSAYLLPNGNVLVDDGADQADETGEPGDPTNLKYGRIMEVTHDPVPIVVSEFDVAPPLTWQPNFSGFWVYRAKRIPSLY